MSDKFALTFMNPSSNSLSIGTRRDAYLLPKVFAKNIWTGRVSSEIPENVVNALVLDDVRRAGKYSRGAVKPLFSELPSIVIAGFVVEHPAPALILP